MSEGICPNMALKVTLRWSTDACLDASDTPSVEKLFSSLFAAPPFSLKTST